MQTNNKLREALERIASFPMPPPIELAQQTAVEMRDVAIAALAEPVRNCEVGTAEEQSRRFCDFCRPRLEPCDRCVCLDGSRKGRCEFVWAQMPYDEGETK